MFFCQAPRVFIPWTVTTVPRYWALAPRLSANLLYSRRFIYWHAIRRAEGRSIRSEPRYRQCRRRASGQQRLHSTDLGSLEMSSASSEVPSPLGQFQRTRVRRLLRPTSSTSSSRITSPSADNCWTSTRSSMMALRSEDRVVASWRHRADTTACCLGWLTHKTSNALCDTG